MVGRRGPSRKLQAFLAAEDLDDLLRARVELGLVGDRDRKAASAIVEEWSDPQAVSNLLFHPDLIPAERRVPCLLRGLDEQELPYYRLAATVGLQSHPPMTESERAAVADRLLRAIEDAAGALRDWEPVEGATTFDEVLAARSSATLPGYVAFADATRLAAQLGHPSETVRQNVLWTLLDLVGRDDAERRIARAVEEGALHPDCDHVARRSARSDAAVGVYPEPQGPLPPTGLRHTALTGLFR